MRRFGLLIGVILLLAIPATAQPTRQVWAFYVSFFHGNNWVDAWLSDQPARGRYDSRQGDVIAQQIDEAKSAGLNAFLVSWFGPGEIQTTTIFETALARASERGFGIGAVVDSFDGNFNRSFDAINASVAKIMTDYVNRPGYLRYAGKPVVFFAFQESAGLSAAQWQQLRNRHDPSRSAWWIAEGINGCCIYGGAMDGMYAFNLSWAGGSLSRFNTERSRMQAAGGTVYLPTIHPGWDETAVAAAQGRPNPSAPVDRAGGQFLANSFNNAIQTGLDVVLVVSWNEYYENSHIEPSQNFGSQSLDTLRPLVASWQAGSSTVVTPVPPPVTGSTPTSTPVTPVTTPIPTVPSVQATPIVPGGTGTVPGFTPSPITVGLPPDGDRINATDADIAVYCVPGGVSIWNTNRITPGMDELVFEVDLAQIAAGVQLANASQQTVLIAEGARGVALYALTDGTLNAVIRETQREAYDFNFEAVRCGSLDPYLNGSGTVPMTPVTPPTTGGTIITPIPGAGTVYVVQAGDTTFRIALRFNSTVSAIAAANNLPDPSRIYVGQTLVIPAGSVTVPPGTGSRCASPYIVKAGDTLSKIARACGTTVTSLATANNLVNINLIEVGMPLIIP